MTAPTQEASSEYRVKTSRSSELFELAKRYMPGGVGGNAKYFAPYPFYVREAKGSRLVDIDGNSYVDFMLGAGTNILGHAPICVVDAVRAQLERAIHTYAPTENEVRLAEKIQQHMPWIERVRFVASGTEATLMALRAARAVTGRPKIAKFEGNWHGQHDAVLFSGLSVAGDARAPVAVEDSLGLLPAAADGVLILPWNDLEAARQLIEAHRDELAAVIFEAVGGFMSGFIPADQEFVAGLREVTRDAGVLLIIDEVITGFRLGLGGACAHYDLTPDLVTLGKIIGGGLPIGAYGGRAEIMEAALDMSAPPQKRIFQSGTFSGNPLSTAAGVAVINELESDPELYTTLAEVGERVRKGLRAIAVDLDLPLQVTGIGSLFHTVFASEAPRNKRDLIASDSDLLTAYDRGLVARGFFIPPGHPAFISTVHSSRELDDFLSVSHELLATITDGHPAMRASSSASTR